MTIRPFRFTVSMPRLREPIGEWRDAVRRIEDLGFSSVAVSDHFTGGWAMDPLVAMGMAVEATSTLRVLGMVFCNDYRHPVLLHKAIANLDVFSGGRVEMGLGAGWMRDEYEAIGLPFDPPATRVDRLAEAIDVITGLFGNEPVTFAGEHYRINNVDGLPKPVQRPRPPLLVGGGGRRVLELAGRTADIVGINPRLGPGTDPVADMSPANIAQRTGWARAAGRDPELQLSVLELRVDDAGSASSLTAGTSPETRRASPAVLHGSVDECVDKLVRVRETYGISYVHLGSNVDVAAPIVARLAGT